MTSKREDIDNDEVHWKYEQEGWTLKEIANYYGTDPGTIYYRLHPDKLNERTIKFKEGILSYQHSEKCKVSYKKYAQSIKGKIRGIKEAHKRRDLGFIQLNALFEGGVWHHIDEEHVICIPEDLHISVYHNLKTGQGMEEVNTIAFQYITEEMFDNLMAGEI